ncbi:MAG: hypothetical protein M3081_06360 [Gemmatimonadota bacterium]|nr:hypothetical protein [Gemmatimonadota bacterium]
MRAEATGLVVYAEQSFSMSMHFPSIPAMRYRWFHVAAALVVVSALVPAAAVVDGETLQAMPGVTLVHGAWFLLIAPLCNVLDALTLMSVRQHIALLVTLVLLYLAWRMTVPRTRARRANRAVGELRVAFRALAALFIVYGVGSVAPRPMAKLVASDTDVVIVDVHSHSNFSLDARPDWSVDDNRRWHRGAGFEIGYLTDHRTWDGLVPARRGNPTRAGDDFSFLPGVELHFKGQTVCALGITERDAVRIWIDPERSRSPQADRVRTAPEPVRVQTIPEKFDRVPAADANGRNGVLAIELVDGAPRGIAQTQRDRVAIIHLADSLGLALVAGSNNHGWGRTAVGWTLVTIPRWRMMPPDSVGDRISDEIRAHRRRATRVALRNSPNPGTSVVALALTLPGVVWRMLTTLSLGERLSWLLWLALFASLALRRGGRRRS